MNFTEYKLNLNNETVKLIINEIEYIINNKQYESTFHLLNNNNIQTPLEKFIRDSVISNSVIDSLNDNYKIEFWFKTSDNYCYNFHFDGDETNNDNYKKKTELTILSYFTDSDNPTIITNIETDNTEKNIELSNYNGEHILSYPSQPLISFIFPKKLHQLVFNGGAYYHGNFPINKEFKNDKRILCAINVFYNYNLNSPMYIPDSNCIRTDNFYSFDKVLLKNKKFFMLPEKVDYVSISNLPSYMSENDNKFDKFHLFEPFLEYINDFKYSYIFVKNIETPTFNINAPLHLKVISVATDCNNYGYKIFLESLNKYNIQYKILGLDCTWEGGNMKNYGGGHKINLLKNELSSWSYQELQSTILLFTDAYDILFTKDYYSIMSQYFDSIHKYKCYNKILFSGEKSCWPESSLSTKYPNQNLIYKYLNSGSFIGSAFNIYNLINNIEIKNNDDDQLYYTTLFLLNKNKIQIDYFCQLFQTTNNSILDINLFDDIVTNNIYNTQPILVHGNGPMENKNYINYLYLFLIKKQTCITYKNVNYDTLFPFHKITDIYIPTYIISLHKDILRRNKLKYKLRCSGIINVNFFNAINGLTDLHNHHFKIADNYTINVGEIGCFLSHYSLWNKIIENNLTNMLILEDDVVFNKTFNHYINRILSEIDISNFDIIFLGSIKINKSIPEKFNDFLNYYTQSNNAHAYILTHKGALKLLNLKPISNIIPVDEYFAQLTDFSMLSTSFDLCNQESRNIFPSNIINSLNLQEYK